MIIPAASGPHACLSASTLAKRPYSPARRLPPPPNRALQGPRHPKAMQLLLSCLNFLRGQYLDAMVAFTTRAEARQGGKGGGRGRGAAAAAAAEGGALTLDDIALWSKVGRGSACPSLPCSWSVDLLGPCCYSPGACVGCACIVFNGSALPLACTAPAPMHML